MKNRGQLTAVADPAAATAAPNQRTGDPVTIDRNEPGHRPGSNPQARTRLYRNGTCMLHDFPVAAIAGSLIGAAYRLRRQGFVARVFHVPA